ncbi:MAG TPA: hypothetical protein DCP91_11565 [Eggerthellaceae bacterium]|nr:hypothetical protein [Eggerthellaceae bacterium]
MTKLQRIANLVLGVLMIACGFILLLEPKSGLLAVAFILGLAVSLYGVKKLVYYIRMARLMTGGLSVLFIAIIAIDVGVFAVAVVDNPQLAIAFYLICYNVLIGVLSIARGIESKLFGAPWVLSIAHGLANIALAALCIAFSNSDEAIIWVFCIGLFYNAGVRMVSAFKPTEIIYIQ